MPIRRTNEPDPDTDHLKEQQLAILKEFLNCTQRAEEPLLNRLDEIEEQLDDR